MNVSCPLILHEDITPCHSYTIPRDNWVHTNFIHIVMKVLSTLWSSVQNMLISLMNICCRQIIRDCVNASEHDAVIFAGTGCTGAMHLLKNSLHLSADNPPVVFAGPYDHHSTLMPWRELTSDVSTNKIVFVKFPFLIGDPVYAWLDGCTEVVFVQPLSSWG